MRAERLEVISVLDPAIDTERMPLAAMTDYVKTRKRSVIAPYLKPAVKPTVFHVCEVRQDLWESFVMATPIEAERYRRAFMCGVESIDELAQNDGSTISSWTPSRDPTGVMRDESIVRVSAQEREEIGAVVWYHSFLARRIDNCLRLPPSSLAALVDRPFHHADASPNLQAPSNGAASSQAASAPPASTPTAPTSESNGGSFGSPTAVGATGTAFADAS